MIIIIIIIIMVLVLLLSLSSLSLLALLSLLCIYIYIYRERYDIYIYIYIYIGMRTFIFNSDRRQASRRPTPAGRRRMRAPAAPAPLKVTASRRFRGRRVFFEADAPLWPLRVPALCGVVLFIFRRSRFVCLFIGARRSQAPSVGSWRSLYPRWPGSGNLKQSTSALASAEAAAAALLGWAKVREVGGKTSKETATSCQTKSRFISTYGVQHPISANVYFMQLPNI